MNGENLSTKLSIVDPVLNKYILWNYLMIEYVARNIPSKKNSPRIYSNLWSSFQITMPTASNEMASPRYLRTVRSFASMLLESIITPDRLNTDLTLLDFEAVLSFRFKSILSLLTESVTDCLFLNPVNFNLLLLYFSELNKKFSILSVILFLAKMVTKSFYFKKSSSF